MFICCELTDDLISSFASHCARSLMIRKWKLSGRFSRLSVTMSWPSHNLRSSTVPSKMVVYQWRADHILPQALNKLKWHGYWLIADFCYVVPSCHYARTWAWDGDKHGFSILNFEWGFGHAENVSEFHAEAVNDEAEGKQEQCQSLVNSFIWVMYSGAQWVCTTRSNITRVLPGDHLSLSWCCLMQWQNLWPMKLGSCTMTMHPHIWLRLSWPNPTFLCFVRLSILLTWVLMIFFFLSTKAENAAERDTIWVTCRYYAESDGPSLLHP